MNNVLAITFFSTEALFVWKSHAMTSLSYGYSKSWVFNIEKDVSMIIELLFSIVAFCFRYYKYTPFTMWMSRYHYYDKKIFHKEITVWKVFCPFHTPYCPNTAEGTSVYGKETRTLIKTILVNIEDILLCLYWNFFFPFAAPVQMINALQHSIGCAKLENCNLPRRSLVLLCLYSGG